MAIITNSGRSAIAAALKDDAIFVAWGTGLEDWDNNTERENRNTTDLTAEIGRTKAKIVGFCTPDDAGEIVMQGNRFTASDTPTPNLHIRVDFDFSDGLGQTIRELGVFVGTELVKGLPKGQRYYTPDNLVSKGTLVALDYITPMQRGVGSKFSLDFVISF